MKKENKLIRGISIGFLVVMIAAVILAIVG